MRSISCRCAALVFAASLYFTVVSGAQNNAPASGAVADGTAQWVPHSRRNPIVLAIQKTKAGIVSVRVPRPNGAKDAIGAGVIIDERGYIVTNRHVVGATQHVRIRLWDGAELEGQVVWGEAAHDLAVIRISTQIKLQALELAPVADLMVGETVIAVGHPFGYSNTVSTGIISSLDREINMPSGDVLSGLIQTNASINPGNSGGPLLNINGEFIGLNVALRDGAQNIAFAINAGTVREVLGKNLSAQKMAGVHHGLACTEKILGETGKRQRVVLADFDSGTAALQNGDEILAVGGRPVANRFDVERSLWDGKPGDKIDLKVARQGQTVVVTLTLAAANNSTGHIADSAPAGPRLSTIATERTKALKNR